MSDLVKFQITVLNKTNHQIKKQKLVQNDYLNKVNFFYSYDALVKPFHWS